MKPTQEERIAEIKDGMQAVKVDNFTLSITKIPQTPDPVTSTYTREYLENQLVAIQGQQDSDNEKREAEKVEVQALLDLCDEQGIVSKTVMHLPIEENIIK
jgi:hypothetical protein